eukprot:Lithocolla_globosa_v1_NODE_611_length_3606_cov_79.596452.p2 type:complete len:173 gc:universal NODE_611_length_3606_cov_79.596452:3362-2844(-)
MLGKVQVINTHPEISDHRLLLLNSNIIWERASLPPRAKLECSNLERAKQATPDKIQEYRDKFQTHYNPPSQLCDPETRWDRIKTAIVTAKEVLIQKLKEKKLLITRLTVEGKKTKPFNAAKRQIKKAATDIYLKKLNNHITNRLEGLARQPMDTGGPATAPQPRDQIEPRQR